MSFDRDKRCKDCRFWVINPADLSNVQPRDRRQGACRVEPPQGVVGMTQVGPQIVMVQYRSPPGWFPCCGKFEQASEDELKWEPPQPIQITNKLPEGENGGPIDISELGGRKRRQ